MAGIFRITIRCFLLFLCRELTRLDRDCLGCVRVWGVWWVCIEERSQHHRWQAAGSGSRLLWHCTFSEHLALLMGSLGALCRGLLGPPQHPSCSHCHCHCHFHCHCPWHRFKNCVKPSRINSCSSCRFCTWFSRVFYRTPQGAVKACGSHGCSLLRAVLWTLWL